MGEPTLTFNNKNVPDFNVRFQTSGNSDKIILLEQRVKVLETKQKY